jgi:hypothetical protein
MQIKNKLLDNGYYFSSGCEYSASWYRCKICHKKSHEEETMRNHVKKNHSENELAELPMEITT